MGYTEEEKALFKQYGDYMRSAGFYSLGGGVNYWRFRYGEEPTETFWIVDLYCDKKFSPSVYQFRWEFDGINDPVLIAIQEGAFNVSYKPNTFDEFKKRIDESVTKFGEFKKYKKQQIMNKKLKIMPTDF